MPNLQMAYLISKNHLELNQTIVFKATILQNQKSKARDTNQTQNNFRKTEAHISLILAHSHLLKSHSKQSLVSCGEKTNKKPSFPVKFSCCTTVRVHVPSTKFHRYMRQNQLLFAFSPPDTKPNNI
jgi:hypothetical protein